MNKVILMGRLTREPDIRYSQGERQMAIARYTLAVDRRGRASAGGEQSADFISCVAFDRSAEFAEKYLHQGTKIVVTGRIQTGSYTNRDGQRVYTTDVVVEEQEFAESKNSSSAANYSGTGNGGDYASKQGGGYQQTSRPAPSTAINEGFMNIPDGVEDEELPFN
ncbi:MAG: single-stranded DNA-binding protein [Lachnospiraceae bacterium]|nr:single-stranded DNA-binding protein [Lachnospiraceae bacterium]